jgi:hypothetical protein
MNQLAASPIERPRAPVSSWHPLGGSFEQGPSKRVNNKGQVTTGRLT